MVVHLQVALPLLTRHVDRAAHASNITAAEYVQEVLKALERMPDGAYWDLFLLMACGADMVSNLVRRKQSMTVVM